MPNLSQSDLRWPHRLAVVLVCATYPLIWIGGLVTTTKSGMAVPDWPSTYGYNMFLYPWETWVYGPFDLFIEHGHRLLASLVGMLCIAFLGLAIWRRDRTLIVLGGVALAVVLSQGILGGLRVVADKTTVARIHGCVGPLCLAWLVYVECYTSRRWQNVSPIESARGGTYLRLSIGFAVIAFLQIMLGSMLRHIPVGMDHGTFRAAVLFHVVTAFLVAAASVALLWVASRDKQRCPNIWRASLIAVLLVVGQIALGITTWIVKYGWPTFLPGGNLYPNLLVHWESWLQSFVVTGHVAVGSLILATAVMLAAYSWKRYPVALKLSQTSEARAHEVIA